MRGTLVLLGTLALVLADGCGSSLELPPSEKLKVKMTDTWVELLGEDTMAAYTITDSTIVNAPAIPVYTVGVVPPAGRTPRAYESTMIKAHITRRGNVRRAWIVSTGSPYFNRAVLKAIIQWKFQPAVSNGMLIDTVMSIAVPLRPGPSTQKEDS